MAAAARSILARVSRLSCPPESVPLLFRAAISWSTVSGLPPAACSCAIKAFISIMVLSLQFSADGSGVALRTGLFHLLHSMRWGADLCMSTPWAADWFGKNVQSPFTSRRFSCIVAYVPKYGAGGKDKHEGIGFFRFARAYRWYVWCDWTGSAGQCDSSRRLYGGCAWAAPCLWIWYTDLRRARQ